jgi:ribosomal protein S18 acetylase RimI-like enzyme
MRARVHAWAACVRIRRCRFACPGADGRWHTASVTISIADLEHAAAPHWRAPDEERLGAWLLRAADGFTGRANSALAAGDPGVPLEHAIEAVVRWYRVRGQPAMIAVSYPAGHPERSELDEILADLGWPVRADAATVMTASTDSIARHASADTSVAMDKAPDAAWLARYHYRGRALPPVAGRLLTSAPWQSFGSIRANGETIAIGRVAASGASAGLHWAGLTAIEVDPGRRRQRLGTAMTAALAERAADQGVPNLYLQVTDGNAAARSLYRRLGFADHHGYHYRVAPT